MSEWLEQRVNRRNGAPALSGWSRRAPRGPNPKNSKLETDLLFDVGGNLRHRPAAQVELVAFAHQRHGYRDNVSYFTIKDFEEPLSQEVRSQIGGISGRLATRMGAAIRHATACFGGIESRRRLLLILSDGRPEDYDDGGDRRYLHEDTRMAVKEAVARGVHPFCITVDTMANQYLPQIFGRGHYMVLDHINSLPNKLPEIYFRLRR